MPAVRHPDPPGVLHEPELVQLPALPAAAALGPLVDRRSAASAATSAGTTPSLPIGVQVWLRTHSEPQPPQTNSGRSPSSVPIVGCLDALDQLQTLRQGWIWRLRTLPV